MPKKPKRKLNGLVKHTGGAAQRKRYKAAEISLAIAQHEAAKALGAPVRDGEKAAGTSVAYSLIRKWMQDRENFAKRAAEETRDELSKSKQGWFRQPEAQKPANVG